MPGVRDIVDVTIRIIKIRKDSAILISLGEINIYTSAVFIHPICGYNDA